MSGRSCSPFGLRAPEGLESVLARSALRAAEGPYGAGGGVVIGECIVDFAAPKARLVVEVDGAYHAARERADARRDRRLAAAGYRVLRVAAQEVMRDLPAVVARIRAAL